MLARKSLWLLVAGVVVMMGCAGFFAWRFFHPMVKKAPVVSASTGGVVGQLIASTPAVAAMSESWHVVGSYWVNGPAWVVLADAANRLRVVSPGGFMGRGLATAGVVDGDRVTTWTGPKLSAPAVLGVSK